jgi:hypothetical protein
VLYPLVSASNEVKPDEALPAPVLVLVPVAVGPADEETVPVTKFCAMVGEGQMDPEQPEDATVLLALPLAVACGDGVQRVTFGAAVGFAGVPLGPLTPLSLMGQQVVHGNRLVVEATKNVGL